jgi:AraC-like DNA-binding protein
MDLLYQHIYLQANESYNLLHVDRPHFIVPWHFHPEIEIMLILEGEGTRIIGDSIENYGRGDLVIVGSAVPHCWKSGPVHYETPEKLRARAHVILFREDSFGTGFFDLPEFYIIKEFFKRAERGLKFTGKTRVSISEKICRAYYLSGLPRFVSFLDILNEMAESSEYEILLSRPNNSISSGADMQRINAVMDYIISNFKNPIRLEDASSLACMAPTSFCRYFKARTNKSFGRFLNEIRIEHAKKLLTSTDYNIDKISFESGFVNVPNFYEQFKKITKYTPAKYKKQQVKLISDFQL